MKTILIPCFCPASFNEAFYGTETIPQDERKVLFHHLFFDKHPNRMDSLLRTILQGQTGDDYTFLANTCVERRGSVNYRNPRIISYLIDCLTQNDSEQFYLYLYRIDSIWRDNTTSKSRTMKSILREFFRTDNNASRYAQCLSFLADGLDEVEDVRRYFSYIGTFNEVKPSYAYALMVLWTVLNVNVVFLLRQIERIIIYKDDPTNTYDHNKRYIIKSALNDNLFISVQKTREPLSDGEGFTHEREMLFSVNSGKFHVPTSVFRIVKCSVYDRHRGDTPSETNTETALINEKEAAKLLKLAQKYLKAGVPDLAASILPQKTEPYYIMVGNKFLTYGSWFSQTRVVLREHRESRSRWSFTKSPNIVGIFNRGQAINMFALDIPNGAQSVPSVMWCFLSFSQAAQRFCIHEVIDWRSIHEERNR